MRQVDYIMDGVRILNDVTGEKDEDGPSDEDIDSQFTDVFLAGRESGTPYNIKTVRVSEQPASI